MPSIKTRQVAGVTALVGAVVVALGLVQIVSIARLSLGDAQARAELLANAMYQAASKAVPGSTDPAQAIRQDPGIRSLLESSVAYARGVAFAAIVDTHGRRHRAQLPRDGGAGDPAARLAGRAQAGGRVDAAPRHLLRPALRGRPAAARRRPAVRVDPHRALDAARAGGPLPGRAPVGPDGARRARRRRAGRHAAGAVDAAAHPRDQERPDAPRPGRVRRAARPAAGGGVPAARQLVRCRERAARADARRRRGGRAGRRPEPRVDRRRARGRGGALRARRRPALRERDDAGDPARRGDRPADGRLARGGPRLPAPRRGRARRRPAARSDGGGLRAGRGRGRRRTRRAGAPGGAARTGRPPARCSWRATSATSTACSRWSTTRASCRRSAG